MEYEQMSPDNRFDYLIQKFRELDRCKEALIRASAQWNSFGKSEEEYQNAKKRYEEINARLRAITGCR